MATAVKGINEIIDRLNKKLKSYKNASLEGMVLSAVHVHEKMDKTPPTIPMDLGNLRASFFYVTKKKKDVGGTFTGPDAAEIGQDHREAMAKAAGQTKGDDPNIVFGFSANYAAPVHEMYGANVKWKKEGSGPGYFEEALKSSEQDIMKILQATLKTSK